MASTIQNILDRIRLEITDKQKARWSDADLILWVRKAVARISPVLYRNSIRFARTSTGITTEAGESTYDLPEDFGTAYGLYRDNNTRVQLLNDEEWELTASAGECAVWTIVNGEDGQQIKVKGTPSAAYTLTLYYYPIIDTSDYATSTDSPWGGKLDDMIIEYVRVCCLNADEQNIAVDLQLMTDIENSIMALYGAQDPLIFQRNGWCPSPATLRTRWN